MPSPSLLPIKCLWPANVGDEYRANFPTPSHENQYSLRIDQNLTAKSRLFGRFFWDHPLSEQAAGNLPIPGLYGIGNREIRNRDLSINHVHTFNTNLINQFTFAYNQVAAAETIKDDNFYDVEALGIKGWKTASKVPPPNITIGSFVQMNSYALLADRDKSYQFTNTTSWIRGRHTWKWGFEYARWYAVNGRNNEAYGGLNFDGAITGDARADFMLGVGDINRQSAITTDLLSQNYAGFFQDDFKFSPRFTLSMGLRYRVNGPWTPQNRLGGVFIANQQSKVIPTAPIGLNYIGDTGRPDFHRQE